MMLEIPRSFEEYIRDDIVFKKKYIDMMFEGCVYVKILSLQDIMVIGKTLSIMIIANKEYCTKMYQDFVNMFKNTIFASSVKFGGNNISVSINLNDFENKIKEWNDGRHVIDYNQMDKGYDVMQKSVLKQESNGIKPFDDETKDMIKKLCDKVNRKTLRSE